MIYRRKRRMQSTLPAGYFHFDNGKNKWMSGFGDGDFVRLRDEFGNEWRGQAERHADNTVRFRFRDSLGHFITGVAEGYGVTLRDEHGNVWRGFIDG
jgi:hypothetical protein